MERWKQIDESVYEVSNIGRVRNTKTGNILKGRSAGAGYHQVQLTIANTKKHFYVHRLVAEAFCNHPDGCNVINHKDNNPSNNNSENLEWVTQRDNIRYSMRQGRNPKFPNFKNVIGIKGNKSFFFTSLNEAATETGCNTQGISDCCLGKRKQHHGYVWKFVEVPA